jgi:peptide/nickel transport system permease protein
MNWFLSLVARKTTQFLLLVFLLTFLTFLLSSLIPGDFYSARRLEPAVRKETVEAQRQAYGLDQPFYRQYLRWLRRTAGLDLGYSLFYQGPVGPVVARALYRTAWIGIPALIIALAVGASLGSLHALHRRRTVGFVIGSITTILLSLPTLVLGLISLLLAARTQWFPLGGMNAPALGSATAAGWLFDRLHHVLLPVACLAMPLTAYAERIQYAAATASLEHPAYRSARARGLSAPRLFYQYLVRPSLNPLLSVSGPLFAAALSGSLVIEVIFSWPGLGQVTYEALFSRDLFLLVGCVTATSVLLMIGSVGADLLLYALDPRIRSQERAGT